MMRLILTCCSLVILTWSSTATRAQTVTFDNLILDAGDAGIPNLTMKAGTGTPVEFTLTGFTQGLAFFNPNNAFPGIWFDVDAPDNSLSMYSSGVVIGDGPPGGDLLHVYADQSSAVPKAKITVENNHPGTPVPRNMFSLINNGAARFSITDTSNMTSWVFSTLANGSFSFSKDGTGGSELQVFANGRVVMGPGGVKNLDLKPNGNLVIAGTLVQSSDRNKKTAIQNVNAEEVLAKVDALPVTTWQFKRDTGGERHIGPMAQDFHAAFGMGGEETTIAPVDVGGVSLAAIKALSRRSAEKDKRIQELESKVTAQEELIAKLARRLDRLEGQGR